MNRFILAGLLALATGGTVQAANILYWTDSSRGTDRMAQALLNISGTHSVMTATSDSDFTTKIASGTYDLGILFVQDNSSSEYTSPQALANFIAGGGRAIYTDWSRNNVIANQLGFSFTGNSNNTSMTVSDAALVSGITNPVGFTNPGWGIFTMGLSSGVQAAQFGGGESAMVFASSGRVIANGFLNDTFADGTTGVQLYQNEIEAATVPEPATLGIAWLGLLLVRTRQA